MYVSIYLVPVEEPNYTKAAWGVGCGWAGERAGLVMVGGIGRRVKISC